jgi:flagellar biosynthetic protein FliP
MKKKLFILTILILFLLIVFSGSVMAVEDTSITVPEITIPGINSDGTESPQEVVDTVELLIFFTMLALVPTFLFMTTGFTRLIVVLSFLRNAMGTQQNPPNMIITGLALFLTLFVMQPVYSQVYDEAVTPYLDGEITQEEAIDIGSVPIKEFMLSHTREKDLSLFYNLSGEEVPEDILDTPFTTIIPAFVISELKTAFQIGFLLFIPFIMIDMVVASILMSMGMFMLPPVMISLPFKVLLFILVDGWYLLVESLMIGFG